MQRNKTLLMVANVDWIFIAHRLPIAKHAIKQGFRVVVVSKDSGRSSEITDAGMEFVDVPISRSGVNPITELVLLVKMFMLYRKINPSVIYQVTLKPVIYGSLIAKLLKIPTVNAISGLGYNFTGERQGYVQTQMIRLMRLGFSKGKNHLIFENKDDFNELNGLGIIAAKNKTTIIKGVGVDLIGNPFTQPIKKDRVVVLLATRMLWDKGVKEFVEAANLLYDTYKDTVCFKLCGKIDIGNPESVPEEFLESIHIKDYLFWDGYSETIFEEYKKSDIVVLPSYREGMPTVLIEASAIGRPLITTDAIGCRECVIEAWNGFKVPVKSVEELATSIEKLILDEDLRLEMGRNSRLKAEKEYSQKEVVKKHVGICESMLHKK